MKKRRWLANEEIEEQIIKKEQERILKIIDNMGSEGYNRINRIVLKSIIKQSNLRRTKR